MHEVIQILDPRPPTDPRDQMLRIGAANGHPLAAGYYLVLTPTKTRSRNLRQRYFGPFPTPVEARLLLTSALALGLTEDAHANPSVARCRPTQHPSWPANDGLGQTMPGWRDPAVCAAC